MNPFTVDLALAVEVLRECGGPGPGTDDEEADRTMILFVLLCPDTPTPLPRKLSGSSLSCSRYRLSQPVRSKVNGFASGEPLTLSMLSSFLGHRGYKLDEAAGMDGLKCEVEGIAERGLLGDTKEAFAFVGDVGREVGKSGLDRAGF